MTSKPEDTERRTFGPVTSLPAAPSAPAAEGKCFPGYTSPPPSMHVDADDANDVVDMSWSSAASIDVPTTAAVALGWTHIRVRRAIDPLDLVDALRQLRREPDDCGHLWRQLLTRDGAIGVKEAEGVIHTEAARRQTHFFSYEGIQADGEARLFAVATVADQINLAFHLPGFPVLARGFVWPEFRKRGLYGVLVRHRVGYCMAKWGRSLRGIHVAAENPIVPRAFLESSLPFSFVRLGAETQEIAGRVHSIPDFLAFAHPFCTELKSELENWMVLEGVASPYRHVLSLACASIERAEDLPVAWGELGRAIVEMRATSDSATRAWGELHAFCEAVPLLP